jgi:acetylglutamate kinase
MNQLTIVKAGGKIIEDAASLKTFLKDFSQIAGHKILIHGGGSTATRLAERLCSTPPVLVDGRRITDEETLKVVVMVYAGLLNKQIVARLQALSLDAIGLSGADLNLIGATRRPVGTIDYGYVGDIREVNVPAFKELLQQNYTPVIAPITHDGAGQLLNTNADTVAGETAKALAYDYNVRLIYCLDKKGVLADENDENSAIPLLTKADFIQYKENGIIRDGMIPKLENAFEAIASGVKEIIITRASDLHTGSGTFIR